MVRQLFVVFLLLVGVAVCEEVERRHKFGFHVQRDVNPAADVIEDREARFWIDNEIDEHQNDQNRMAPPIMVKPFGANGGFRLPNFNFGADNDKQLEVNPFKDQKVVVENPFHFTNNDDWMKNAE